MKLEIDTGDYEPQAKSPNMLNLHIGGLYRNKKDEVIQIIHSCQENGEIRFIGDNNERFHYNGINDTSPQQDLIEEHIPTAVKPQAKSEYIGCNYHQLHPDFIRRVAKIHAEGEKKYGHQNATLGLTDQRWLNDRFDHAMDHLLRYREGDRSEDHLAKVGWFLDLMMKVETANKK